MADAVVNGAPQRTESTACQQSDGNWKPVAANYARPARSAPPPMSGATNAAVSSDTILKVQQRLHDLGFYVQDNIDGQWGPHTSTAVKNFQRSKGLDASGQLNEPTLTALGVR